uniref:Uncharacterized protein n=1 Tax=uncultured gamma proteobacterium HF0010_16J05 TaxID=710981 RepID=E0XR61_9GAMM|nr:hypothetical protein [uncultured gamma proteobacterium HF0010_16J05]
MSKKRAFTDQATRRKYYGHSFFVLVGYAPFVLTGSAPTPN